jgi:hypothetical protein
MVVSSSGNRPMALACHAEAMEAPLESTLKDA